MAITVTAQYNARLIDELDAFADGFEKEAAQTAQNTVDALEPLLLANLRQQPGSVSRPIQWQSDKQRKAYFASDGFGGGIPSVRTGAYANSWFVDTTISGGDVSIVIGNTTDYAQFVGGSLNQRSPREAARPQQAMHKNTGWNLAVDSVNPFLEQVQEDTVDAIRAQYTDSVDTLVKRRSKIT